MDADKSSSITAMQMTFFWGKNTEILFSTWPGKSSAMYAVALIYVFVLALSLEWLANCRVFMRSTLLQSFRHLVRIGFGYMVILALISFNGGVFIAVLVGHTLGFWLFSKGPHVSTGAARGRRAAASSH